MKFKTERLLVDFISSDYYSEYDELIHNLNPSFASLLSQIVKAKQGA